MTKVVARFRLQSPLSEAQLMRLSDARSLYGLLDVKLEETAASVTIEYDATRLTAAEVGAVLRAAGIPAVQE